MPGVRGDALLLVVPGRQDPHLSPRVGLELHPAQRQSALSVARSYLTPGTDLLPDDTPPAVAHQEFQRAFGLSAQQPERVVFDPTRQALIVSDEFARAKGGALKFKNAGHVRYIRCYPRMLTDPDEIWLTPMRFGDGRIELRRRYIRIFKTPDHERVGVGMIMEFSGSRWIGTSAFGPEKFDYMDNRMRKGVLLHARN